ncbi:MAG: flagellar export protein FliJ [Burkholderiales bacterium]
MKQFVFTLQPLYDMQESIEKQYKMQMSEIEAELLKRLNDLDVLSSNFERMKREYCEAMAAGVQAVKIKEYGHFFERLKAVMALMQDKIASLEKEKEKCLAKLVQARREKKLLDKVRENQYSEYMDELKKEQDKLVDDLISYRASV